MKLTISPGALGPIVQLGFGPTGAVMDLATAPEATEVDDGDLVLIVRAGVLEKIGTAAFLSSITAAAEAAAVAAVAAQLTTINSEISSINAGTFTAAMTTQVEALVQIALENLQMQQGTG